MSKHSRCGGKFTGNHTTLIPLACLTSDIAGKLDCVSKISPGLIKAGLKSVSGDRRVKLTPDPETKSILLGVRDNTSFQEVRIFSEKLQETMLLLSCNLRNEGISINFKKN